MSFVRHKGVSREPLEGLGFLWCRLLGRGSPAVRLPLTIPCASYSFSGSDSSPQLFLQLHQGDGFDSCVGRSPSEGGSRTSSLGSGVLRSPLCHPKVTGGWRPVIGLSRLSRSVLVSSFHMETSTSVLQSLRPGDWMVSSDLQDACLQIPVHPSSFHYLRFCVGSSVLQFCGLSSAPQVFTWVMSPVSVIMHRYGFCILRDLDDWLVLGSSFREVMRARDFLLWLCQELGIRVNPSKSSLDPSQKLDYLGMSLQTRLLKFFPTQRRVLKLSSLLQKFVSCPQQPLELWR